MNIIGIMTLKKMWSHNRVSRVGSITLTTLNEVGLKIAIQHYITLHKYWRSSLTLGP